MLVATLGALGKLRANLFGFGGAKFGEQRKGYLPVTAGLARVADGVARPAEAAVRAGLMVLFAGLDGQVERSGVFGTQVVAAQPLLTEAQIGQRERLAGTVASLPVYGQGLPVEADGLPVAALVVDEGEVGQGPCLPGGCLTARWRGRPSRARRRAR